MMCTDSCRSKAKSQTVIHIPGHRNKTLLNPDLNMHLHIIRCVLEKHKTWCINSCWKVNLYDKYPCSRDAVVNLIIIVVWSNFIHVLLLACLTGLLFLSILKCIAFILLLLFKLCIVVCKLSGME